MVVEWRRFVSAKAGQTHGIEVHHLADVLLAIAELLQQAEDLAEALDGEGVVPSLVSLMAASIRRSGDEARRYGACASGRILLFR